MVTKHEPATHRAAAHHEPKPVRLTDAQKAKASLAALTDMVRQAETAGQRDAPHVVRAREVLDQANQAEDKTHG